VTANELGGSPSTEEGGSLAYDAWDGYYVFFGGCSVTACPDNATWILRGGFWQNVTSSLPIAPPARQQASLTYDPDLPGLLLFGGCGRVCPLNDTWEFSGGLWSNLSAQCNVPSSCPPPLWGASLTYQNSPWNNSAVLFGGCPSAPANPCAAASNRTWEFNLTGGGWWSHALAGPATPSARFGASIAFDPSGNFSVLFGGCNVPVAGCFLNDTWVFANYTWVNLTPAYLPRSLASPPARGFASIIVSGTDGTVRLFGGINTTLNAPVNDTWQLVCGFVCYWSRLSMPAAPDGSANAAGPDWVPSGVDPVLFGGFGPRGQRVGTTWVFGSILSVQSMIAPTVGEVSLTSTFSGVAGLGSGQYWYIWNLDPLTPGSATLVVRGAQAGTFNYTLVGGDIISDMSGSVTLSYRWVAFIQATSRTVLTGADDGVPVGFVATPAPGSGVPPISYTWNFGDGGAIVTGATPFHTYAVPGTYGVSVNISDADGAWNISRLTVTVRPLPTATANASTIVTDVGLPATFRAGVTNGSPPYTFHWSFGGGGTSNLQNATHIFATAGSFNASLTATDAAGAVALAQVPIAIEPAPNATVGFTPVAPIAGTPTNFTARPSGGTGSGFYRWNFGDGGSSLLSDPSHVYTRAGNYTATFWFNDSVGGSTEQRLVVPVKNATVTPGPGQGGGGSPLVPAWVYLLIAIAAILAVGGGAVLLQRRRRSHAAAVPAGLRPPHFRGGPPAQNESRTIGAWTPPVPKAHPE
jgi:PKD repeat protein